MLDIPGTANLEKEENGVAWYIERKGVNTINYMVFDGRVLVGGWVGPHWVFWCLVTMTPDERNNYCEHDELMGVITRRLWQMRG